MSVSYDDGHYRIDGSTFATRSRIYPLANATASLRRDFQWLAAAISAVAAAALAIYGDLLEPTEKIAIVGIALFAVFAAINMGILVLDTPGHRRAVFFGRAKTMRKIFDVLRTVRSADFRQSFVAHRTEDDFGN